MGNWRLTSVTIRRAAAAAALAPILSLRALGAGYLEPSAGTTGAEFLTIGAGARAAGMGEAHCAKVDDASAMFWNPAGLTRLQKGSAVFMHARMIEAVSYDYAAIARPVGLAGAIGMSAQYLWMDRLEALDNAGNKVSDYSPNDMAITVAGAHKFAGVPMGVGLKYIRSTIMESASTLAVDVGMMKEYRDVSFGAAIQNLGGQLKYRNEGSSLPLNLKAGVSAFLGKNWSVAFDANLRRHNRPWAALGAEYEQILGDGLAGALRFGANTRTLESGLGAVFTAGAGMRVGGLDADYAFVPYGGMRNTHRLSLTLRFGPSRGAPLRHFSLRRSEFSGTNKPI